MNAYRELEARFARLGAVGQAAMHLHWDQSVMMPPGGAEARGEQLAALSAIRHEILSADVTENLIQDAEIQGGLDEWQQANLGEMKRRWTGATAVSGDLVAALARAVTACETKWRDARAERDFASVRPLLQTVLDLVIETAEARAGKLNLSPYDALMEKYSPGITSEKIDLVFGDLGAFLPDFLGRVMEKQAAEPAPLIPEGPFPAARQRELGEDMMRRLGFDFEAGRLDESLHPFSSGTHGDHRITTKYSDDDFVFGLMGVLHETGHALYEKGLPADWRRQPVGESLGMDIHESQSLIIEMQACRSPEFLGFAAPLMRAAFGGEGAAWDPENLVRLYTRVKPGFIRVDADEVTYPAHVILRYELERALIGGDLTLSDLPGAWNDGMERLLGIVPPDDGLGVLQDIHWYDGAFGYFPSYTLGAIGAAQLFDAARQADADVLPAIGRGDFGPLYAWLGGNVHGLGRRYPSEELLTRATGRPLDVETFKSHLRVRYLDA